MEWPLPPDAPAHKPTRRRMKLATLKHAHICDQQLHEQYEGDPFELGRRIVEAAELVDVQRASTQVNKRSRVL